MKLRFTKMHGAGNDFVVIDGVRQSVALAPDQIRRIADRHRGVGCDQVLIVGAPRSSEADFSYRIFNADGGEVEQCGNGARCFVRFVREQGLTDKNEIRVETLSGLIAPRLEADGEVTVNMGPPVFEAGRIPFLSPGGALVEEIDIAGVGVMITALSMGNPHAVQVVHDVDAAPVTSQGPVLERHALFPRRVNAGYMQVIDRQRIRLRVWERGAGETLACGTGACAAAVAGIRRGLLVSPVCVSTRGGDLTIRWDGSENDLNCAVWMTGPAVTVFAGELDLDRLP
ncbi:MAG: diaminopimelate epimerase [Betaproteobacteria bacterium RIFCSPLOWO2_02_FULL_62_17]|nr:MAG: diaminopimelate epimerase [Betaproteobacteria bacterium RIFCSPLOWO2_02_FULL_62_17]